MAIVMDMAGVHSHSFKAGIHPHFKKCLKVFRIAENTLHTDLDSWRL